MQDDEFVNDMMLINERGLESWGSLTGQASNVHSLSRVYTLARAQKHTARQQTIFSSLAVLSTNIHSLDTIFNNQTVSKLKYTNASSIFKGSHRFLIAVKIQIALSFKSYCCRFGLLLLLTNPLFRAWLRADDITFLSSMSIISCRWTKNPSCN